MTESEIINECPICQETNFPLDKLVILSCNHIICNKCFEMEGMEDLVFCPFCRIKNMENPKWVCPHCRRLTTKPESQVICPYCKKSKLEGPKKYSYENPQPNRKRKPKKKKVPIVSYKKPSVKSGNNIRFKNNSVEAYKSTQKQIVRPVHSGIAWLPKGGPKKKLTQKRTLTKAQTKLKKSKFVKRKVGNNK